VVNGILIGMDVRTELPDGICTSGQKEGGPDSDTSVDAAIGTELYVSPAYLPAGAQAGSNWSVICDGEVISTVQQWNLDSPGIGAAVLIVARLRSANYAFLFDTSEDRVRETTVNGSPGALVLPITSDGFGPAAVAIRGINLLTIVSGMNLTIEELTRVAEGLSE
jgi:hypothetical protein